MQPPQAIKIVFVQVTDGSPSLKLVVSGLFPAFFFLTPNRHKIWSLIPRSLLLPLLGHLRHHPLLVSLLSHKLYLFCLLSWFLFIILSFKYCIVSGSGSHISSLLYSSSSPLTPLVILKTWSFKFHLHRESSQKDASPTNSFLAPNCV